MYYINIRNKYEYKSAKIIIIYNKRMLASLKNKASKKQAKKQTTKKVAKEQKKVDEQVQQEQSTDLVDISELKQESNKPKQNARKKNDYQLEQKVIDVSNLNLQKNQKPKVITSWKVDRVEDVMKDDFKMEKIDHEFISLTDEKLNEQLLVKQKQEEEKKKNAPIFFQNNLKLQVLEKTPDQLKMEKAEQGLQFNQASNNAQISTSSAPVKSFVNSNFSGEGNFKPIQKTAQQIRMQQAQRREQEIIASKPATTSWLGGKKAQVPAEQKTVFKTSAWVTMATENQNSDVGANIKFAPLNPSDVQKQPTRKIDQAPTQMKKTDQVQKTQAKKTEEAPKAQQKTWAANTIEDTNGIKFAPLQMSVQEQRMKQADRKEPELVFVSKKQQQQRRKKREQREKDQKAKQSKS